MVERLVDSEQNARRIAHIESCFGHHGQPLAIPGRVLVGEGILLKVCRKKQKQRQFFLFNDIIVYGTILISKRKYHQQHIIPLEEVQIENLPDDAERRNAWLMKTRTKSFIVRAATVYEKDEWMNHIKRCINERLTLGGTHLGQKGGTSHAAVWVQDKEAPRCLRCKKTEFNLIQRRHHCRNCGLVVCGACSSKRFLIPSMSKTPLRVCQQCYSDLSTKGPGGANGNAGSYAAQSNNYPQGGDAGDFGDLSSGEDNSDDDPIPGDEADPNAFQSHLHLTPDNCEMPDIDVVPSQPPQTAPQADQQKLEGDSANQLDNFHSDRNGGTDGKNGTGEGLSISVVNGENTEEPIDEDGEQASPMSDPEQESDEQNNNGTSALDAGLSPLLTPPSSTKCGICSTKPALYSCPGCTYKTCSLKCSTDHKVKHACDGKERIERFKTLRQFDNVDFIDDMRFLSSVERSCRDSHKNLMRAKVTDEERNRLRQAAEVHRFAKTRGFRLEAMPSYMDRHKQNRSQYNKFCDTIFWTVEWRFPDADNFSCIRHRIPETVTLATLMRQLIQPRIKLDIIPELEAYRGAGPEAWEPLMLVERNGWTKDKRYYRLDPTLKLSEALKMKVLIDFPAIVVVLKSSLDKYPVLTDEMRLHTLRSRLWLRSGGVSEMSLPQIGAALTLKPPPRVKILPGQRSLPGQPNVPGTKESRPSPGLPEVLKPGDKVTMPRLKKNMMKEGRALKQLAKQSRKIVKEQTGHFGPRPGRNQNNLQMSGFQGHEHFQQQRMQRVPFRNGAQNRPEIILTGGATRGQGEPYFDLGPGTKETGGNSSNLGSSEPKPGSSSQSLICKTSPTTPQQQQSSGKRRRDFDQPKDRSQPLILDECQDEEPAVKRVSPIISAKNAIWTNPGPRGFQNGRGSHYNNQRAPVRPLVVYGDGFRDARSSNPAILSRNDGGQQNGWSGGQKFNSGGVKSRNFGPGNVHQEFNSGGVKMTNFGPGNVQGGRYGSLGSFPSDVRNARWNSKASRVEAKVEKSPGTVGSGGNSKSSKVPNPQNCGARKESREERLDFFNLDGGLSDLSDSD